MELKIISRELFPLEERNDFSKRTQCLKITHWDNGTKNIDNYFVSNSDYVRCLDALEAAEKQIEELSTGGHLRNL